MENSNAAVGLRVLCNGYHGKILKVCDGQLAGMIEVRVPGGVVCVGISEVVALNGYVGFYGSKQQDFYALTSYDAQKQAVAAFKPPKSKAHLVHVHLAEVAGKPVVHTPDF